MINQTGTIRLSGDASVSFANALFRPTREAVQRHNRILDQISRDVVIHRNEEGFTAECADLDLSFLDDKPSSNSMEVELIVDSVCADYSFNSDTDTWGSFLTVSVECNSEYSIPVERVCLTCAA